MSLRAKRSNPTIQQYNAPVLAMTLFMIYFFIANFLIFLSNIPLIILTLKTPVLSYFPLFHPHHIPDYNGYISAITLGQHGSWLFRNPYTSEPSGSLLFYFPYVLSGKLLSVFGLPAPVIYHLLRILSAELFVLGVYKLANLLFDRKKSLLAPLLSLILTFSPVLFLMNNFPKINFLPWWDNLDALERLNAIPHHILAQALFLFALFFLIKSLKTKVIASNRESIEKRSPANRRDPAEAGQSPYDLIIALSTAFLSGIIFPPAVFPFFIGIPLYFFIKNKRLTLNEIKNLIPVLFATLLSLFIGWWQTRNPAVKSVWVDWEIDKWNRGEPSFNLNLLAAFSFLFIINIPGMIKLIKSGKFEKIFLVIWALCPFILLPFVDILGISKIRLIFSAPFVSWGILTVYTLTAIRKKYFSIIFIIFITVISVITTAITLSQNIRASLNEPIYSNVYYSPDRMASLEFIEKTIPKNSVILSDEHIGNIIPAFAPVISYFGHINLTQNFTKKQHNVWLFYTGGYNEDEALNFLKNNGIKYVYAGDDEKTLSGKPLSYNFLKEPIFQNSTVRIYQVN